MMRHSLVCQISDLTWEMLSIAVCEALWLNADLHRQSNQPVAVTDAAKMEMIPHWLPICKHDQKQQGQDSQHFN